MALMWWGTDFWQICMHHCTVHEKVDFPKFPLGTGGRGIFHNFWSCTQKWSSQIFLCWSVGGYIQQLLMLNSEMKDLHWYLYGVSCNIKHITAIFYSHFKSIFSIENRVNEHFQVALMWWGTGFWQICMHHCTVCEKVDFPKFPSDTRGGLFHNFWSCTQKWSKKIFICWSLGGGYIQQLVILNSEMKYLHWYPLCI